MKLKLLLAFVALSMISCSDDESNGPVTNKDLDEVITFIEGEKVELNKFENNRLTERYLYDVNGGIFIDDQYTYDTQGKLLLRTIILDGETNTQNFEYDESGRLELVSTETPYYTSEQLFDYSVPGKIIRTEYQTTGDGDELIREMTFDLDQQERVYKITEGEPGNINYIHQAVFEGNNIIQVTETNYNGPEGETVITTTDLAYNTNMPVKGEYLKIKRNQFAGNTINAVLFHSSLYIQNDNYMAYFSNGEINTVIAYEFDNDGFPERIIHLPDVEDRVVEISYK